MAQMGASLNAQTEQNFLNMQRDTFAVVLQSDTNAKYAKGHYPKGYP